MIPTLIDDIDHTIIQLEDLLRDLEARQYTLPQPRPEPGTDPRAPIQVRMKAGKGYGWLAEAINRQMSEVPEWNPLTAEQLRQRMSGQMLYRDHLYVFPTAELMGNASLTGGMREEQVRVAQARAQRWLHQGRDEYIARRNLSRLLSVVDEEAIARPDQVTADEFDQAVDDYSRIRRDVGDLTLDTDHMGPAAAQQFRDESLEQVETLMSTWVGREQIHQLGHNTLKDLHGQERRFLADGTEVTGTRLHEEGAPIHRHTTLTDYHQDSQVVVRADGTRQIGDGNHDNDHHAPRNYTNAKADDEDRGQSLLQADGKPGKGSDTTIRINPERPIRGRHGELNTPQDVVLMHEMVHAGHQTQGTLAPHRVQITTGPHGAPDSCGLDAISTGHPDLNSDWVDLDHDGRVDAGERLPVWESEHQAAGIGRHACDLLTENAYRDERREIGALNRDGTPLSERAAYTAMP